MTKKLYKYAEEYRKNLQPVTGRRFREAAKYVEALSAEKLKHDPDIDRLVAGHSEEYSYQKIVEECGELSDAMREYFLCMSTKTRQHLIEEMVDVMISIECVCQLVNIKPAELIDMRHHKMERNLRRLEV